MPYYTLRTLHPSLKFVVANGNSKVNTHFKLKEYRMVVLDIRYRHVGSIRTPKAR